MQPFGVGVLGATGYIGTPYRAEIREARADARIIALCARRRDLLEAAARQDDAPFISDDWRKVVDHPEVNLVVVATPDAMHHEAVMACAAAGKHVVCEKPIGMNVTEASLSLDRLSGRLLLARAGQDPELLSTVPNPGFGNRFVHHVFPALHARITGEPTEHPGLDDGWSVQRFTDACVRSAQQGTWINLADAQPLSNHGDAARRSPTLF